MVDKSPMHKLTIKKGFRLRMAGEPSPDLSELSDPSQLALLPEHIPHIKPRLKVAEGDKVQIGSLLFEDKRQARFKFLSPAGGVISRIQFGPRRVIQAIVINRDTGGEGRLDFKAVSEQVLIKMSRDQLVERILDDGMWWVFRELPFRDLPHPDAVPPLILVGLDAKEPFLPSPAVYLKGKDALLAYGLKVLAKLTDGQVVVFADAQRLAELGPAGHRVTHQVSAVYPGDDPGTILYHLKSSAVENRAWYIGGQDLLALAQLLAKGQYPIHRVVAVGGAEASVRQHYRVRMGGPLSQLIAGQTLNGSERLIVGGVLRGFAGSTDGFMGLYETALNILPAASEGEFLALFNPGPGKPSYSRTFLSKLNPKPLAYDCKLHGDRRACIACMHCADVCPVGILPQMVFKAIKVEEVEEYLELGLLDCVECGLCAYVCPSKIELTQTFVATKAAYAKEQAGKTE